MIYSTDVYVVFDHVQFGKKSWQQRNKIKTSNGVIWLSVPTKREKRETRICDIKISYDHGNLLEKHWKTIELAYKKAPYFSKYKAFFETIFYKKYVLLRDLNVEITKGICDILGIKTGVVFSSELGLNDVNMGKTEKVVNLCKKAGITHLYDAKGAEELIDDFIFHKEGISITFQHFEHPAYKQLWGNFIPYLSVIDLLFNEGDKSLDIIRNGRRKPIDYIIFREKHLK